MTKDLMSVIWDQQAECMGRAAMEKVQIERLHRTVHRVYEKVPFYRQLFDKHGLKPEDIKDLADIRKLPFTNKENIRENYPYGLFCVPLRKIIRLHASSGTTGKPTVVGYTKADIKLWAGLTARIISAADVSARDIAQISFGYGLFAGGFGLHYGLERIGATVIPASTGNTERQIMLMRDFGTTVLFCTPSYSFHLAETAQELGIDPTSLKLRLGLIGSEGCSDKMRQKIENLWGITALENYGLSEIIGPGVAGECCVKQGLHISEDHFYPEIIDPASGEVLPPGAVGELVLTNLSREGLSLLRYRTHDITSLDYSPCSCGRTTVRMTKVLGRSDDMLKIRGVKIFPSQIEEVLANIPEVGPYYNIIVRSKGYRDELEIKAELADALLVDDLKALAKLQAKICRKLKAVLGIDSNVCLVHPKTLTRSEGKAKHVFDLRKVE